MKSYRITSDNLDKFLSQDDSKFEPHLITDIFGMQSHMHFEGFKKFYNALQDNKTSLNDLKTKYAAHLLEDLEKLSKINSINKKLKGNKFDKLFFKNLESGESSEEYNNFIKNISNISYAQNTPIPILGKILQKIQKPISIFGIREFTEQELNAYDELQKGQSEKGFNRMAILYKGRDQKVQSITLDDLKQDPNLTGEQKEFIEKSWHQSSFMTSGTTTPLTLWKMPEAMNVQKMVNTVNNTEILIDASKEGRLIVQNRGRLDEISLEDIENDAKFGKEIFDILLNVDISNLKADKFLPGLSSNKSEIFVDININLKENWIFQVFLR